jgi:hypothetical protein
LKTFIVNFPVEGWESEPDFALVFVEDDRVAGYQVRKLDNQIIAALPKW